MKWQKIFVFLLFLGNVRAVRSTEIETISNSVLLSEGFSPKQTVEWRRELQKGRSSFLTWANQLPEKEKRKLFGFLHKKQIKYQPSIKTTKAKPESYGTKEKDSTPPKVHVKGTTPYFFLGGSGQNLELRYLPTKEKNHSSFYFGYVNQNLRSILEKRDEEILGGIETKISWFYMSLGSRYKPIPHFFFAKDPNFYSQFERKNSPLPQPIRPSAFLGIVLPKYVPNLGMGVYYSPYVSTDPGFYINSPNSSYSATWSPSGISYLYINDFWNSPVYGKHNLQGESKFSPKESLGYVFLRSSSPGDRFQLDSSFYKDSSSLFLSIEDSQKGLSQSLAYTRFRYLKYYSLEFLGAEFGIQKEGGYGLFLPLFITEYGALGPRYRDYFEEGGVRLYSVGRALQYEWRVKTITASLAYEKREFGGQYEGKITVPMNGPNLFELSCIYREGELKTRSWFENWTYATDFNMTLTDRREILKLRWIHKYISLNISYSERKESLDPILFINIQALYQFEP